ncbi:ubiquitin carboxyl-terminal hydrolase 35 [Bicyclus anynana]|uniref:Ubiquitin carboxyl-terminal hydrolase 35 n=1 Tax=Bicyclus anynana TaxID=110368 RepID=A0A6J1NLY7_BICAN|nr:ubiquitin carboxyl-terminal hydrolase 35 [Bicyclus anynana]XP_023945943.1 ubiquitin carboxyl-terminal hydrolase 35 [Bicyclus anynana]XP_023946025.1 ubiquitin carboxyl-terminal hydrolase 35 [Bicyclus anynana]XP_052746736.1 ubiquitin carboxyl-terminal hydrolase 35 [Bicyclus anynana]XP_052746737.1 ubiquitin carboxyl-terminal hydrolase 35 [Bicyclus anynana]
MAVKKHQLVADKSNQPDLAALAQYFQLMNDQSQCLPPLQEMIKQCHNIIQCLARTAGTADQLWHLLQPVEHFLLRCVNSVYNNVRHEVFRTILDKFYSYISDPESNACPATAAVLIIIDDSDEDEIMSSTRLLVEQTENGPAGPRFHAALSCLYRWLHDWHCTPTLGFWILAYIKALEESAHHDILIEASQDYLVSLLSCLALQIPIHQATANVIFHVLASLRESVEAFDRISSMVGEVLVHLASDNGQWSRQLLQDLVDILTVMVERITCCLKEDAQEMFRNKYADVILCLERHMASNASKYLNLPAWRSRNAVSSGNNLDTQKVGLINIGNTCYMNSVIQALLYTRQFSSYVVAKSLNTPYWETLGTLFAHMIFSMSSKIDPERFFRHLRPVDFSADSQHDSSEFLGYLLELFRSYENATLVNHDYSRPPVLNGGPRNRLLQPGASDEQQTESGDSRRSTSPCPGSSGSDSSALKRPYDVDPSALPPRKRFRVQEPTRRGSAIDSIFGGVQLTRVQCGSCQSSSFSRDLFRDLQLAFPEKPEGKQHSVQSLLDYYFSKESLCGDNKYQCRECGDLRDAERSVVIENTPKYLILVLKHFKVDVKNLKQTKLMHYVHYNQTISLPTVPNQATSAAYTVYAAVIHKGRTIDSGHYYTLVKDNGEWFSCNDCSVKKVEENALNKLQRPSTPYILFYRRLDIEEPPAPTFEQLPRNLRMEISATNKIYVEAVRKLRSD